MKRLIALALLVYCISAAGTAQAMSLDQLKKQFDPGSYLQVRETNDSCFILVSSLFKDAYAERNLAVLSRAALYRYFVQQNPKITGIEVKGFTVDFFYEENNRLFAVSEVKKKNLRPLYEAKSREEINDPIRSEITRLEALSSKNRAVHEQLKEFYFLIGDIENYEKQSDILMELIFNEE